MKPIFEMDVNAFVRSLKSIQLDPKILKTIEATLSDCIERNAREKLKNGPFSTMIAEGVTSKVDGWRRLERPINNFKKFARQRNIGFCSAATILDTLMKCVQIRIVPLHNQIRFCF